MKVATAYFRRKAEQCRRLAQPLANQNNDIAAELLSMANEFDENARALETKLEAKLRMVWA